MWPLQVSGNLPDTGSKVKSQARVVMSRMMSLHAHVRCLRSSRLAALHPTSTSPCSCASCKEEVSLAATRQERQKREAKRNADEAASELHKIDNIGEDSEKHAILSVSAAKKLKKLVKPTLESLLTAKPGDENESGLLSCRTCAVKYHLIKSESPNLQVQCG